MDESGLNYDVDEEHAAIAVGFRGNADETTYRDADGDPHIQIIVRLLEHGEFCAAFVPKAWNIADCEHRAIVCETATRIQSTVKLIRFDLEEEGHLQPNVEIPLEKTPMCAEQLQRAIASLLLLISQFDPVIRHAMTTGEVDLDLAKEDPPELPTEITQILGLAEEKGVGMDEIERLLGGEGTTPTDA
jgi:hypothetical protein